MSSGISIKRAFVLGAGLGTRLGVLTRHLPKPLVPICQKPLITFAFDHLIASGIEEFVVNTHHCAAAYTLAFPEGSYRGRPIHFRHEPDLLETAGGLRNAADLLGGDPFVVYNGDILCDLPLDRALQFHAEQKNEVTLVLRSSGGPLQIACDPLSGAVLDIGQRRSGEGTKIQAPLHLFSGIYIVQPEFLERIPAATKLSVIPVFMEMIQAGARLGGVVIDEGHWWDLGTRSSYLEVHRFHRDNGQPWPLWIHPNAEVAPDSSLSGATSIAAGAQVGPGACLHDTVVWENAVISGGARLRNCIVTASCRVSGNHDDCDF